MLIASEIMKIIAKRETLKKKKNQTKTEKGNRDRSYNERIRAKWFCCVFKLGFLQLLCKASLIFKLNFELSLSIVIKQRELYYMSQSILRWTVDV